PHRQAACSRGTQRGAGSQFQERSTGNSMAMHLSPSPGTGHTNPAPATRLHARSPSSAQPLGFESVTGRLARLETGTPGMAPATPTRSDLSLPVLSVPSVAPLGPAASPRFSFPRGPTLTTVPPRTPAN